MAGSYSRAQVMDSECAGARDSGGEAAAAWEVTGTAAEGHGLAKTAWVLRSLRCGCEMMGVMATGGRLRSMHARGMQTQRHVLVVAQDRA